MLRRVAPSSNFDLPLNGIDRALNGIEPGSCAIRVLDYNPSISDLVVDKRADE